MQNNNFNENVFTDKSAYIRFNCQREDGTVKEVLAKKYEEYFHNEVKAIDLFSRQTTSNYNESSYLIDLFWAAPLTMDGRRYVAESINDIAYFYNHNGIIEMGLDYSEIAGNKRFVEER